MRNTGKLGKLDPDHTRPALRFGALLKAGAPVPPSADYVSQVEGWPMYMNDALGICAIAAPGHAIEGWTHYAKGKTVVLPDNAILKGYEDVGGYDPSQADANGNNPTDVGCVLQDVFDYWRKTGIGGDKILFFAKVDPRNAAEVAAAIYYFGHIIYGIQVPRSAMEQFKRGQAWDVVNNDGGSLGGHAVNVGAYSNDSIYTAVTWGTAQHVSQAFFKAYADEAWVIATTDWINTVGQAPAGFDAEALNAEFTALTGEAGPFPIVTPIPTPTPQPDPTPPGPPQPPTPVPGPVEPDAADVDIAPVITHLVDHHWVSKHNQAALQQWLRRKGL